MGTLMYGRPAEKIEIEDRTLAHIKIVILAKLRRAEAFAFSFEHDDHVEGRSTIWMHPSIPLQFSFPSTQQPTINRQWLDLLVVSANSVDGLRLIPEPSEVPPKEG